MACARSLSNNGLVVDWAMIKDGGKKNIVVRGWVDKMRSLEM